MITLAQMIDRFGLRHHEATKPAFITQDGSVTYAEARERMWKMVRALQELGIGPGSRIAILMSNRPDYLLLFAAATSLDASVSPVNVRFVASEIAAIVDYARFDLMILDPDFEQTGRAALAAADENSRPRLQVLSSRTVSDEENLDQLIAKQDQSALESVADPDACTYLAFTGGTTGSRKAAVVPAQNFYHTASMITAHLGVSREDVTITCGSFSHTMPFYYCTVQLYNGGSVVVLPKFNARAVVDAIQRHRVTWMAAVPTMYSDIMDVLERDPGAEVSSIQRFASSGAPLLTATKTRLMEHLGPNLYEYYGATELGWSTTLEPRDQLRKVRCVGQAMPGTAIEVIDPSGRPCEPGEIGIVYTTGDVLMREYLDLPEETKEVFRGAWATAGDMGYLDDEGYLYLVDRSKDMIVSGGINVYPVETEEVLAQVEGTVEVACIGAPDDRWGEAVVAVCVVHGDTNEWERRARAAVEKSLASYKHPKRYDFVNSLPRSHAGKILKRIIREPYWQGHDRTI